jgi:hypothetical protein
MFVSLRISWEKRDYSDEKQAMLEAAWWLYIMLEREAGRLPAWEGLRVVRER